MRLYNVRSLPGDCMVRIKTPLGNEIDRLFSFVLREQTSVPVSENTLIVFRPFEGRRNFTVPFSLISCRGVGAEDCAGLPSLLFRECPYTTAIFRGLDY